MTVEQKIIVTLKDQTFELTAQEATVLRDKLNDVLPEDEPQDAATGDGILETLKKLQDAEPVRPAIPYPVPVPTWPEFPKFPRERYPWESPVWC